MQDKCSYIAELVKKENLESVNENSKGIVPKKSFYVGVIKRLIDIIVSFPVCILLIPFNVCFAIITFFDVGRPILFVQKRTGLNGKTISIVKFRNMTNEKDKYGNLLPPSQRVTKFGTFMRRTSLDELLSFYTILKGDMSLIGPRPLPVEFTDRMSERHKMRYSVKPGLECPSLDSDGHVRLYQEQFENDVWYAENVSFAVDCKMVAGLFKMVFNHKERSDHAVVDGGNFVGYNQDGEAFSMRRIPEKYEKMYSEYLEMNK